jgi:hypothetical protein
MSHKPRAPLLLVVEVDMLMELMVCYSLPGIGHLKLNIKLVKIRVKSFFAPSYCVSPKQSVPYLAHGSNAHSELHWESSACVSCLLFTGHCDPKSF